MYEQRYESDVPIQTTTGAKQIDRVRTIDYSTPFRIVAVVAAAVPTLWGLIAIAKVSWSSGGFDAPAVSVAGLMFTPAVAVGTFALGLVGLLVGASRDRASKLVYGVVLVCIGIAVLVAQPTGSRYAFDDGHGWLALAVGAVLITTGALLQRGRRTSRTVRHEVI